MRITDENFDKYSELYRIYDWQFDKMLEKKDKKLYKKYRTLNTLNIVATVSVLVGMVCFDLAVVPVKDFIPVLIGSVVAATALGVGGLITINTTIKDKLIEKFEKENPNLEIMPKQELKKKLSRHLQRSIDKNKSKDLEVVEVKEEDLVDDYEKEKRLHQTPTEINLDFRLASKFYTPDEKIAFLEAEKEFWVRAKEKEPNYKAKQKIK